jgi:hypothetical protein
MENIGWPTILILIGALEAFIGALPNTWVPYHSIILKFFKFLEEL